MDTWPYIFESPDGGETVYIRRHGETERRLYHVTEKALTRANELQEAQFWHEIRQEARLDKTIQKALDHVKLLYLLKKSQSDQK